MFFTLILLAGLASPLLAQQAGTVSQETHPPLTIYKCTTNGGCVAQSAKVVLNQNWRWLHGPGPSYTKCLDDSTHQWNSALCPDPVSCAKNCYLDGADYNQYGISTSGNALTLLLFPPNGGVGSRVHLLSDDTHYWEMNLKNQEISFDVDVSGLPCGTNGAAYLLNMAADGGTSQYANNKAGAKYGTGYCDAQCPQDVKFINGEANSLGWNTGSQTGQYGSCCHEMDLWEANAYSTAYTAHTCNAVGQFRCSGSACGVSGNCDKSGCDYNPYRMGNTNFYGIGKTIGPSASNPQKKFRVTTQFITDTGTASGTLKEIRRFYVLPSGQVIANPSSSVIGVSGNSLTDAYCSAEKSTFGESNTFATKGGMSSMSSGLAAGMVPTFSVYIDYATEMLWLDSIFPQGGNPSTPGVKRGPCDPNPPQGYNQVAPINSTLPSAQVKFSNIRYGDISSTVGPPYPS